MKTCNFQEMTVNRLLVKGEMKITLILNGPQCEKACLRGFANNKGADQPAHRPRLISALVICVLESIISKHGTSDILIF